MEQEKNGKDEIIQGLKSIQQSVKYLGEKIDKQDARITKLESMISVKEDKKGPVFDNLVPPSSVEQFKVQPILQKTYSAPAISEEKTNLEENIGVTWFARIGIVALILGTSFFLKYAFDNNWIGETGRVMIGIISGIILLGLGEKYIRKYLVYGQIMSGGGIVVLYLSIFAAFNFYHFLGQSPAFLAMIIITAMGIVLSFRYNSISLIIISNLGGFATPFLISSGQNNQIGLLSYVLLLDSAILVVSIFRKWRELNIIGFIGTVLIFSIWATQFYTRKDLFVTIVFLTLFFIIYSISSLIYNLIKKEKSTGVEQMLMLFSGVAYFSSSYILLNQEYHIIMGFFALILATYYFLWAYCVRVLTPEDNNLYDFLAFLAIGFMTIAIPIHFKQNIITISWAVEAIILFILGIKIGKKSIKELGFLVFGLSISKLIIFDSEYELQYINIFNKTFFTFLFVILISYLSAYIFRKMVQKEDNFLNIKQLVAMLIIVANFLTIFIGSREIIFFWDQQKDSFIKSENRKIVDQKRFSPATNYNDRDYYNEQIKKIENKSSVALSIFWLIYGIILMIVGIFRKYKGIRIGGMLLFILAILKLFFYDLWELGTLYRIISSISLGVVLLGISFSYQKYKDKLREII